jgi:hypothetical protein
MTFTSSANSKLQSLTFFKKISRSYRIKNQFETVYAERRKDNYHENLQQKCYRQFPPFSLCFQIT